MNEQIIEELEKDYGKFEGDIIDTITIGIGKFPDKYCIINVDTKQIIHNHLTESQASLLFEDIKKRIR